jgi:pimeloyl-ACP methyl ester carboxylesterase
MTPVETLTLADGRELTYDTYGDPDGMPVIFNHGVFDSRLIRNPDEQLTASLGLRMIAADQPGVGGSTSMKGRRMVDWGEDMEQLADALGLDRFAVAGHSGGGPHALSIAAHLPDRVTRGVLASPLGPLNQDGFAKLVLWKDMRLLLKLRHFPPVVRRALRSEVTKMKMDIGRAIEGFAESLPSEADTLLSDPAQRAMFEENLAAGVAQDEEGAFEMVRAAWDWAFEIEDVKQRFDVFYGDADEVLAPEMAARVAERLPNGTGHVWPGAGHIALINRPRWTEFLGALRES